MPFATLQGRCDQAGLDLCAPFDAAAWNATAPTAERLPTFDGPHGLAVVIGNTRRLWPTFRAAYAARPELQTSRNPLDDYVVQELSAAVAATGVRAHLRWAHIIHPLAVPIQRIAAHAGLAALGPAHLCVHPTFGPWFALRAVIVLDAPPLPDAALASPCSGCAAPCVPALAIAAADRPRLHDDTWRAWLAVRDACPVGREHRYDDDQIEYHYAKRRDAITRSTS